MPANGRRDLIRRLKVNSNCNLITATEAPRPQLCWRWEIAIVLKLPPASSSSCLCLLTNCGWHRVRTHAHTHTHTRARARAYYVDVNWDVKWNVTSEDVAAVGFNIVAVHDHDAVSFRKRVPALWGEPSVWVLRMEETILRLHWKYRTQVPPKGPCPST